MGIFFPVAFFRGDLFSGANIRLDGGGLISGVDFSVLFPVGLFSGLGDLFSVLLWSVAPPDLGQVGLTVC